jgi:hypothetical protein
MLRSRFNAAIAVLLACAAAVCGCTLLTPMSDVFVFHSNSNGTQNLLTPLRPARDALQIDVVFVERPLGDPLLGKTLWNDIDQVAGFESSELDSVKQLGILIGNAGSNPCPALERMLRDSADPIDAADAKNCLKLHKQTFCVRNSEASSIETNAVEHCTLDLPLFTGPREKKYDKFKSILRLTALRLQDGWAKLEFAPEIHHGVERVRPMVVNGDWQQKESQEVDTLPQRFSLKLHVGEIAVMTAAPASPRSFGHHAFIRENAEKGSVQRLLVVRLSNMSRIDAVYSTSESRTAASPATGAYSK